MRKNTLCFWTRQHEKSCVQNERMKKNELSGLSMLLKMLTKKKKGVGGLNYELNKGLLRI